MLGYGFEKWKEIAAALPFLWWGEHQGGQIWAFRSLKNPPCGRIERSSGPLPPYNCKENPKKE